jgi:Ras-related protein Rab-7A
MKKQYLFKIVVLGDSGSVYHVNMTHPHERIAASPRALRISRDSLASFCIGSSFDANTQNSVGKTSLMNRLCNNRFSDTYKATIGVDFLSQEVTLDSQPITLQIWDTAGQERFTSLGTAFYRGSDALVLVYDVNSRESFENLENWHREFSAHSRVDMSNFPVIVIGSHFTRSRMRISARKTLISRFLPGNKVDLDTRCVTETKAVEWCEAHGLAVINYFECSAKTNQNVQAAFNRATRLCYDKEVGTRSTVTKTQEEHVDLNPTKNKTGCC